MYIFDSRSGSGRLAVTLTVIFALSVLSLPVFASTSDTPPVGKECDCSKIEELRKKLAEQEQLIAELEKEGGLNRDVHPTIKRLRGVISELRATIEKKNKRLSRVQDLTKEKQRELNELQKEFQSIEEAETSRSGGEVTVTLDDTILFDLGEVALKDKAKDTLSEIDDLLNEYDGYRIFVQGHTDNIPSGDDFNSNWELSAQRAVNVVRYLDEEAGLEGDRLVAAGYGEYYPLLPNNNAENRKRNRRVEIKLVPMELLEADETLEAGEE